MRNRFGMTRIEKPFEEYLQECVIIYTNNRTFPGVVTEIGDQFITLNPYLGDNYEKDRIEKILVNENSKINLIQIIAIEGLESLEDLKKYCEWYNNQNNPDNQDKQKQS
jgi:hypothetical protein